METKLPLGTLPALPPGMPVTEARKGDRVKPTPYGAWHEVVDAPGKYGAMVIMNLRNTKSGRIVQHWFAPSDRFYGLERA